MKNVIINENCITGLKKLESNSIDCCVTSPPYFGLRDYGTDEQIGLEETPEQFVSALVDVFREVKRVLKDDGTLWLNLGDSYAGNNSQASNNGRAGFGNERERIVNRTGNGLKPKDLIGIPWRVAFALQTDGWYLRQDIIWHKPNPMPESVTDRCTKAHEYIFLLSKSQRYHYDADAIKEEANYDGRKDTVMKGSTKYKDTPIMPNQSIQTMAQRGHERWSKNDDGEFVKNKSSVWTVTIKPYSGAHFATFPQDLIEPCIKAGCPKDGIVLDPFMGAGTTAIVSRKLSRNYIGFELNAEYVKIAEQRINDELGFFV
jgi:DNA modification methylase